MQTIFYIIASTQCFQFICTFGSHCKKLISATSTFDFKYLTLEFINETLNDILSSLKQYIV